MSLLILSFNNTKYFHTERTDSYTSVHTESVNKIDLFFFTNMTNFTRAMFGEREYIDINYCSNDAQILIKELKIDKVHNCTTYPSNDDSSLVMLEYGPGMDCPSGCFYETLFAFVSKERVITDNDFFFSPYEILYDIEMSEEVSLFDGRRLDAYSDIEFSYNSGTKTVTMIISKDNLKGKILYKDGKILEKELETNR